MAESDGQALLISALITAASYAAFPLIYGRCKKPDVSKKKYRRMCFLVNFGVHVVFSILAGLGGAEWETALYRWAPYVLWTSIWAPFFWFVFSPEGQGTAPEEKKSDGPKPGLKKPEPERVPEKVSSPAVEKTEEKRHGDSAEPGSPAPEYGGDILSFYTDYTSQYGKAPELREGGNIDTKPVYCRYCGASIERTAQFCPYCKKLQMLSVMAEMPDKLNGETVVTEKRAREIAQEEVRKFFLETMPTTATRSTPAAAKGTTYTAPPSSSAPPKKGKGGWGPSVIAVLIGCGLLAFAFFSESDGEDIVPSSTRATPAPTAKAERAQNMPANGTVFVKPTYEAYCPFQVSVRGENGYYVYLEYLRVPKQSYNSRHATGKSKINIEDMSFFVRPGQSVEVDVPIGIYKLYYATGTEWYGMSKLFGEDTLYFEGNDLLIFYTDYTTHYGNTVELWEQVGGNFDTDPISASEFPG